MSKAGTDTESQDIKLGASHTQSYIRLTAVLSGTVSPLPFIETESLDRSMDLLKLTKPVGGPVNKTQKLGFDLEVIGDL